MASHLPAVTGFTGSLCRQLQPLLLCCCTSSSSCAAADISRLCSRRAATGGSSWTYCADKRDDPCSCAPPAPGGGRGGGGGRRLSDGWEQDVVQGHRGLQGADFDQREARACPGLKEWDWVRNGEFPHCGVQCVGDAIQDIRLEAAGLNGPLPDLSALSDLDTLDLTYNALTGPLPASLGSMVSLETFAIGTVDGVATDQLPSLTGALPDFCGGGGGGIGGGHRRAQGGGGSSLRQLLVYSAPGITGRMPSLAGCSSLELLHIQGTGMTGPLPQTLFSLPALETLMIRNNDLTDAIPSIVAPDGLQVRKRVFCDAILYLNGVIYQDRLGTNIGKIEKRGRVVVQRLRTLDLSANRLTGNMPDLSPRLLPSLERLQLRVNDISGTISPLPRTLRYLDLSNNKISGSLPDDFAQHDALLGACGKLVRLF